MRLAFLKDDRAEARGVLALFDAPIELLAGEGRRHQRKQLRAPSEHWCYPGATPALPRIKTKTACANAGR